MNKKKEMPTSTTLSDREGVDKVEEAASAGETPVNETVVEEAASVEETQVNETVVEEAASPGETPVNTQGSIAIGLMKKHNINTIYKVGKYWFIDKSLAVNHSHASGREIKTFNI